MINIQEQVKIGFNHISSELRSLSSSVPPQQRISQLKRKPIEHRQASIKKDRLFDESNDLEADNEQDIEEINPEYEDSYSEGEEEYEDYYEDSKLQEEAQKEFVKKTRKEIRVCYAYIIFNYKN
jgi:hypothetical protein